MPSLWNYLREYPGRYADQFSQGMREYARTRNPVFALGALNPTTPFIQDAALQAGGLIAPRVNQLNQAVSQASENLGLGPLAIPEVTDEQLAPFLMLGMGSPTKMGFYSPSGKALTTAPGKGTSQQYLAHLKKEPGATKEGKQTGLIQKLEEAPGTLTKEEVVSMWNPIELTETVRGGSPIDPIVLDAHSGDMVVPQQPKYGNQENLNLPGGEGPKEILVQLPDKGAERLEQINSRLSSIKTTIENAGDMSRYDNFKPEVKANIYEQRDKLLKEQADLLSEKEALNANPLFRGGHWEEPNVLAHIRTNKRDVGGVRALHAEEFQSDWHQAGQKKGYVDADQKRVLESRLAQIEEEMKASNQRIAGDDTPNLLKKLDGDTSGLNVGISKNSQGGTNFNDRNWTVTTTPTGSRSPSHDYPSIGYIDREGNLSTTKYTTPEQKILLEKHAELVKELNSTKDELGLMFGSGAVPDAPFKKDWHELAFKRFLMEGINDPSVDRITWTSGDVQADRYNLAKYINEIEAEPNESGEFSIAVKYKEGNVEHLTNVPSDKLSDYVGKEMAEKIVADKGGTYSGLDLEIGGEFHKNLYDKKIPQFAKKFLKKYGVEPKKIPSWGLEIVEGEFRPDIGERKTAPSYEIWSDFPEEFVEGFETREEAEEFIERYQENLWYIDITPEMRRDLQQKGVPLAMNPFLRSEKLSPFMA